MNIRACLAALALSTAALAEGSTSADAGTPPEKPQEKTRAVVHLKDGGLIRGTVKRLKLGKSITLTLASGKTVTFDEPEIVTIEILGGAAPADDGAFAEQSVTAAAPAKPAAAPSKTPPAPPPPPPAAPASDLDTVYLNDGSILRGFVESEKPDVVVRLLSGRKRNLSPKDVKNIVRHTEKAKKP
jgi:hypothetical protein